jgi:lactoylglutathione lyase
LWGDRLVARFDSKLDRTTNTFVILGLWLEDEALGRMKRLPRRWRAGLRASSLFSRLRASWTEHYEKFGFKIFGGDATQNWLILKNGDHVIGLFQGMFEKNILTFNPGWDSDAQQLAAFTDVRELQRQLKAQGVSLVQEADESTTGPASFVAIDPDGNPILVDQHV